MIVLVAVAAAVGTLIRVALRARLDGPRPFGTLTANVAGSFALGLLVGADVTPEAVTIVGTGGLGALTTWSSVATAPDQRPSTTGLAVGAPLLAAALGVAIGVALS